jgi:hypothetical protein
MANVTATQAVAKLRSYIHKPRTTLPWLKGRTNLLDCAAAVSWIIGATPDIVSCGVWVDHFKAQKTWYTTGIPQVGDFVIFDWTSGKGMGKGNINHDHIGIVEKADKKGVTYVSADSTRPVPGLVTDNYVGYKYILGYGRPKYLKG